VLETESLKRYSWVSAALAAGVAASNGINSKLRVMNSDNLVGACFIG
jgi:hypothetical protein